MNPITLDPAMAGSLASTLGRVLASLDVPREELCSALNQFLPLSWRDVTATLGEAAALERAITAFDVAKLISDITAVPIAVVSAEASPSKPQPLPWWRINGEVRP